MTEAIRVLDAVVIDALMPEQTVMKKLYYQETPCMYPKMNRNTAVSYSDMDLLR